MGDDQERAAARGEVAGEPVHALDVEVVGRLVEQQQLGLVEQRAGERDAAPLAARERRERRVHALREAAQLDTAEQAVEHRAEPGSPAHSWSARPPTSSSRIVVAESRSSPCPSSSSDTDAVRVTVPASGSSAPASSRRRVDLPSPLRPTTPIRSPALTPSVTSRRIVRAA